MRRKDKEISDITVLEQIISESTVCRIAMCDGNIPYIVPMSFGYENRTLYLHCAREGRKIDILKTNPRVCVEWESKTELVKNNTACNWGMKFYSVIAEGNATFIADIKEKEHGLSLIMKQYSGKADYSFSKESGDAIIIVRIDFDVLSGKKSGY
jgi:uncharacterized protein